MGILLLAVLAAFANVAVLEGLVTDGDAGKTARDIMASEGTFRVAVLALYLVVALDVMVAWALQRVFQCVHSGLAVLTAWFRLAYAAVFAVAVGQLAGVHDLLNTRDKAAFTPAQVDAAALAKVDMFTAIWMAGLLLFGIHLVLLGYLAYRSGEMPRLLGVLLVIDGLGYVFDTAASVMTTHPAFTISSFTFLGEFLLAVWLVIRGHRLAPDPFSSTPALPQTV